MSNRMLIAVMTLMFIAITAIFSNVYLGEIERRDVVIDELENKIRTLSSNNDKMLQTIDDLEESLDSHKMVELQYKGDFWCTYYCTEKYPHICGSGNGITASGQPVQADVTVAVGADSGIPYGTVIYIEGVGIRIVQDTGSAVKSNQIDIAVKTHNEALYEHQNGHHKVYILKVGG